MTLTAPQLRKLIRLANGKVLPSSQMKGALGEEMLNEGILIGINHKSRLSYRAMSPDAILQFLKDRFNIADPAQALTAMESESMERSELVKISGDSKFKRQRTMKGFLVTALEPIETSLNGRPFVITPPEGSFVYIYDYEQFRIPEDVLVIGVENSENFRFLSRQAYLFPKKKILFAARYPLSGDFPKWLAAISNRYLHFGDFDLAGIHIYLTEIYKAIGNRASFFIPEDIEELLKHGSPERYDKQLQYGNMDIADESLKQLVALIHKYKRGYDQEGLIQRQNSNH